jgi:tetratricopeptide (TPR) repeat protein
MTLAVNAKKTTGYLLVLIAIALFALPSVLNAQTLPELKAQAKALYDANKFPEALPLLEKIAAAEPNNGENQYYLGFALIGQALNTPDVAARKALRVRARAAFLKALELGIEERARLNLVKGMADGIPADGSDPAGYSDIREANALMDKGEAAFSTGKMDDALAAYQAALKLDAHLYHAALYCGDVYMQQGKYTDAEVWYQKAIAIDPFIETAHRYSATPFMKQQKYDLARDRYIESYILAPYNRVAMSGFLQWGEAMGTRLGHPKIDVPDIMVNEVGKVSTSLNINPLVDDGSMAWMFYVTTRSAWRAERYSKQYPGTPYRHTLAEEAEALRSVVKAAKELKAKNPNPQLDTLSKMDADGVLEAYILLAIPDEGIAYDHAAYVRQNRDKLRKYVVKYIIGAAK